MKRATGGIFVFNVLFKSETCKFVCQVPFNVVCIYKERTSQFGSIHSYSLTLGISHDRNS